MTGWQRLLLVAAMVPLGAAPTRAQAPETDPLAEAERQAEADHETEAGRAFAEQVGRAFGRDHSSTVGACARKAKRRDLVSFRLLLGFDAEGVVEGRLVDPANGLSACVSDAVAGWKVGPPPHAGTWVVVHVELARK